MIALNTRVTAVKDQIYTELAGEMAILHVTRGIYYGLDEVGARIWELIQEPHTVSQLVEAIVAEYDVTPERCRQDLIALLEQLAAEELITVTNDTAA